MVREREDGRQRGVQQIGCQQIKGHGPQRPVRPARKWSNDRPPKEERRSKETSMLELVPKRRAQCQVESRRHMPRTERYCHHHPAIKRLRYRVPNPAQRWPNQKGAHSVASEFPWEPAQQWEERRAEQYQRRGDGHEQQVLHHMGRKQQTRKSIERRSNSEPESCKPACEGQSAP